MSLSLQTMSYLYQLNNEGTYIDQSGCHWNVHRILSECDKSNIWLNQGKILPVSGVNVLSYKD